MNEQYDAIVIGGGFYGCAIAIYLARSRNFTRILIIEQEDALLQRASYTNQARVHNGYHYPRSFTTAYRSRINLPKFVQDWPYAIKKDFTKLYAIAKRNSKVNAKQFERFCTEIGAYIEEADDSLKSLFERRLIEQVFITQEYAFDTTKLAQWALAEINNLNINLRLNSTAKALYKREPSGIEVILSNPQGSQQSLLTSFVFNCTYSGINHLEGDFPGVSTEIKQEITEMALVELPEDIKNIGITVMDGAYFSIMPFPARELHTLSHVRYTPHISWSDDKAINPYKKFSDYTKETRVDRMIRDVARYMPKITGAKYTDSLFEVKTVLVKNEGDDGRPILFEKHLSLPGCFSILGGKIDNIYDVLEKLNTEPLNL